MKFKPGDVVVLGNNEGMVAAIGCEAEVIEYGSQYQDHYHEWVNVKWLQASYKSKDNRVGYQSDGHYETYRFDLVPPSASIDPGVANRQIDEFGFPLPKKEEISMEDLILVKGFLGNLKDQTLSRSTHRVLQDLLQRL